MHRFFVSEPILGTDYEIKNLNLVKQLTSVLRMSHGARLVLFDNTGFEFESEINKIEKNKISLKILNKKQGLSFDRKIGIAISLLKKDNLEWVIQKSVELGVCEIYLILSERCVKNEVSQAQVKRLEEIIIEAVEQSEGALIPKLHELVKYDKFVKNLDKKKTYLIAAERRSTKTLDKFGNNDQIVYLVGPEGGYSDKEVILAQEFGIIPVSLGQRILRAETAAIAGLARLILK